MAVAVAMGKVTPDQSDEQASMQITEFEFDLDKGPQVNWLRARIETVRGNPSSFALQYETMIDDERVPIVRYDTAHGRAHRDLLDRQGRTAHKRFVPNEWTTKEALDRAFNDIIDNWHNYRERFLRGE